VTDDRSVGADQISTKSAADSDTNIPESASILPLDSDVFPEAEMPHSEIDPQIAAKLKRGKEQQKVVGRLVEYLVSAGWRLDQMVFGRREWRVPRNPSESHKRDSNQSFNGYPCDVAIFDSPERLRDPHHLIMIVDTKAPKESGKSDKTPKEQRGVTQLETYMGLEPHVRVGVWVDNADPSAPAIFVFRD
jgi:type I restriction enzyme M protein